MKKHIPVLVAALLLAGSAYANHPVLLEGNCDSPVPGTTLVAANTCGDFDGDGRIGTAEDTDGADRIFGTLEAAIGPGTGASAGTGANHNGSILIVTSGRFVPTTTISIPNVAGVTHLTIEAAPGVSALIDAVLQGDPASGSTTRQNVVGMHITAADANDRIVLRNLVFRNWAEGVRVNGGARVTIENCTFHHNLDYGLRVMGSAHVAVSNTRFFDTGTRSGVGVTSFAAPGTAIRFEDSSSGVISKSIIVNSIGNALVNNSSGGATAVRYYQLVTGANGAGIVNATRTDF